MVYPQFTFAFKTKLKAMRTKLLLLLNFAVLFGMANVKAQVTCPDLNGYVNYKNTGGTGDYTLTMGSVEKAAQTYKYSAAGNITAVRVYGTYTASLGGGVPLVVSIYQVDANGRPTSLIQSTNFIWWWFNNIPGYIDVPLGGGGAAVSGNFAVEVGLRSVFPFGNSFNVKYTGNGEGRGEDLASLAGTSTGGNWSSAKNDFNLDGDFYLVPQMDNYLKSDFSASAVCINAGTTVTFTNSSQLTRDSMFNTIAMSSYSGNNHFYEWNFGDGSAVSYATSPTHTYSTPGVYTVSLKSTIDGWHGSCSETHTMKISVGLAASVSSITNATCYGQNNGSIVAAGTGGSPAYTYSIDNEMYQGSANFNNLHAGSYTLSIKDSVGCLAQTNFSISQPTAFQFAPNGTTNASCGHSDGAILVSAMGGTGTIQYRLNSGPYLPTGSFSSLSAGTYTVTIKDANNCTASTTVAVNDAGGPSLNVVSRTNVSCNGNSDGSIVLNGTGGSGTLQYSINGGANFQPSGSFLNLPAGVYGAMVKDALGCAQSAVINITQPTPLRLAVAPSSVSCYGGNNGQISVLAAIGGTGSFSYSINGNVFQSGTIFSGLTAGTYTVYLKDAGGCTASTTTLVSQPDNISTTLNITNATCNGSYNGAITISAIGGVGNYMYSLNGESFQNLPAFNELAAGSYNVYVQDANNCLYVTNASITEPSVISATITTTSSTCGNSNGGFLVTASGGTGSAYQYSIDNATFNNTGSFTSLASGTYFVIIADSVGCANILPATIIDANGPTITGSAHTNVSCNAGNDGTISITGVSGGTGVLEYSINGNNWQLTPDFYFLFAGTYIVTVKDANSCTGNITVTLTQPNAFVMNTTETNVVCNGNATGSITVYASGGAGVLAYGIDNNTTFQSSNTFSNLFAGTHKVIVRDAAGCTSSVNVHITQPSPIIVTSYALNVSCANANNGAISLVVSGGNGSYQYSLDSVSYGLSNVFSGLDGGAYVAYVKDTTNCVVKTPVEIKEPLPLNVNATVGNVSCSGGNNGSIALSISGGTQPYYTNWSMEWGNQDISNLYAGTYIVRVTDNNGCFIKDTLEVTQPASPLIVNAVITGAATSASEDGAITLTVTGGVAPYTFLWSNEATTKDLTQIKAGTYSVNITDVNGCITSGIFVVSAINGIANISDATATINIYPNPTSDAFTVETSNAIISSIKIINVAGQSVLESQPKESKVQIAASNLASGMYFIQVQTDSGVVTRMVSISR